MRYIYSYNSFNGKRLPTPFEKKMALLSVNSLHEATGEETTFYGDIDTVQFVLDNKIPFDNIYSHRFEHNNSVFWNSGKLEIYALQNQPFLHVDFDTVFFKGFSVPEADIVTEKIREFEDSPELRKFAIRELKNPQKLICSGLLGGSWNNAFYELRENLYRNRGKLHSETASFEELISFEEYALTQIVEHYKLKVEELDNRFFAHWQGANKQQRFGTIINELCEMYGI